MIAAVRGSFSAGKFPCSTGGAASLARAILRCSNGTHLARCRAANGGGGSGGARRARAAAAGAGHGTQPAGSAADARKFLILVLVPAHGAVIAVRGIFRRGHAAGPAWHTLRAIDPRAWTADAAVAWARPAAVPDAGTFGAGGSFLAARAVRSSRVLLEIAVCTRGLRAVAA